MKLSDTQAVILCAAAQHPHGLVAPPAKLGPAPQDAVRKSLLTKGLIEATELCDRTTTWAVDGDRVSYRITPVALAALGREPEAMHTEGPTVAAGESQAIQALGQPAESEPASAALPARPGASLREVGLHVLSAWDQAGHVGLPDAIEALRARLPSGRRNAGAPRPPREGTKQQAVLAMLRRTEGATVAQVAEAMGWEQHTVRGFFAGLKRKGITVAVQERVRQVGPNKQGAKGSYSVYRIVEAG